MKTNNELINNWINKADKDLTTAEHEITFPDAVTEGIITISTYLLEGTSS